MEHLNDMLSHKTLSLNKFNKIEIISSVFSNCNGIKLCQFQKENWKKPHKHVETEHHVTKTITKQLTKTITKQLMKRSKRKSKHILKQIKM